MASTGACCGGRMQILVSKQVPCRPTGCRWCRCCNCLTSDPVAAGQAPVRFADQVDSCTGHDRETTG